MDTATAFLPAKRMRPDLLRLWQEILPRYRDLRLLRLVETPWAIVTETRQILIANTGFEALTAASLDTAVGKRPGEILACVHATGAGGCGTSAACRECGAAQVLFQAIHEGRPASARTAFLRHTGGRIQAINAQVTAAPFQVGFTPFALLSLTPTTEATEHEVLERLFFHDLLNGMNGIVGALTLAHDRQQGEFREFLGVVLERAWAMTREIRAYKTLHAAERGTFSATLEPMDLAAICRQMATLHRADPAASGKTIATRVPETLPMLSDPQLVTRVVENLLKNALEASETGDTVTLALERDGDTAVLTVANPAVMPAAVQARVFQRGHSTKGTGRGFGTYGVRLFGENYLAGRVEFRSTPETGTVFTVRLPLSHPLAPAEERNRLQAL